MPLDSALWGVSTRFVLNGLEMKTILNSLSLRIVGPWVSRSASIHPPFDALVFRPVFTYYFISEVCS